MHTFQELKITYLIHVITTIELLKIRKSLLNEMRMLIKNKCKCSLQIDMKHNDVCCICHFIYLSIYTFVYKVVAIVEIMYGMRLSFGATN